MNIIRKLLFSNNNGSSLAEGQAIQGSPAQELLEELTDMKSTIQRLSVDLQAANKRNASLQATLQKRTEALDKLKTTRTQLAARVRQQNETMSSLRTRARRFAKNTAINRYLAFAQTVGEQSEECQADLYVAHGVQALPAADRLKQLTGGKVACDAIEIPSFAKRALPSKWDPTVLKMIDHALLGYLREADFLLTVGWTLGDQLARDNPDVRVVPNYRHHQMPCRTEAMREEFGIPPDAKIILCLSTVASGLEDVLETISTTDDSVHLVVVGRVVPDDYQKKIEDLGNSLDLAGRFHVRAPVPYDMLVPYCSGADVGLIVRDPAIPNNHVSLPNRVFDYIACGLPIVAPMMPDIHRVITEHECGVSIETPSATDWGKGINQALENNRALRLNATEAARVLTWESLEAGPLLDAFDQAKSVTFVGFNNLSENNRTLRMAASLTKLGVNVKIASPLNETDTLPENVIGINIDNV